ncbi:MAG: nitric-oxide reductase large subunit [Thermomonas sp.]|uniref:nitric-oxide reductase large subunit n=1 Tax=Thermomonas sp. TaxID=1971895 RepID=UPI001EC4E33A|nr:nitric-oxide reductase large subunit [Thermomonas sp.]MBV2209246.1 nitric-oxide reductase large subunit [Thermomonas sp.]
MSINKRLWLGLGALLAASFAVMLWLGVDLIRTKPPIPDKVISANGDVIYTKDDIMKGQQVWQSIGGQQLGSVWGHGALIAPDWSADWLHREIEAMLELQARADTGQSYASMEADEKAKTEASVKPQIRQNTYDPVKNEIVVSNQRARAISNVAAHYESLFSNDPTTHDLREAYAMREGTIPNADHRRSLTAFFFWAAWATGTDRPGYTNRTYTNNWPYEPLIGNKPTSDNFIWSMFSILFMIGGIGLLAWHYAAFHGKEEQLTPPAEDPLSKIVITPSMRATAKYFWVVAALFLFQILLGATTAHFQVEGQEAYGLKIAEFLPYSLTRSWHTQLAVLWIATAWLATGLYIGPAVSGHEPKYQRAGVNFLFVCLLIIVVGSFAGQWFAVMQKMDLKYNFWFGHQGWEYVDIGRFWQAFLFIGLLLWLVLVGRSLWPALKRKDEMSSIVGLLFLSTIAIALFYGAGLMWGEKSHMSVVDYWRWWVVHLWVEGFFEVFAVAVMSFLFVKLGLVRGKSATVNVLFATIVFMSGGVLGMFHHLYFSGTTTAAVALGASFSALEVVPLALIGLEAFETWSHSRSTPWMERYRWPIMFFLACSFWNLIGAGLFGFLVNTPIALYYMQGLNLTALHGHTALFGVYGTLGIGLMLFCLRGLRPQVEWPNGLLRGSFWCLNIGLGLMAMLTLLPLGVLQLNAVLENGYWFARSAEFMNRPIIDMLVWMRMPGDTVFAVGALLLCLFIAYKWLKPKTAVK